MASLTSDAGFTPVMSIDDNGHVHGTDGRYLEKHHSAPETELPAAASAVTEEAEAGFVREGDGVPFRDPYGRMNPQIWHAYERDREFRRRYKAAGKPETMRVVGVRRSEFDPHSDNTLLFDLGDGEPPYGLDFHRESTLWITRES